MVRVGCSGIREANTLYKHGDAGPSARSRLYERASDAHSAVRQLDRAADTRENRHQRRQFSTASSSLDYTVSLSLKKKNCRLFNLLQPELTRTDILRIFGTRYVLIVLASEYIHTYISFISGNMAHMRN